MLKIIAPEQITEGYIHRAHAVEPGPHCMTIGMPGKWRTCLRLEDFAPRQLTFSESKVTCPDCQEDNPLAL